jgi:tripartite-type tricarboxylate transporter receptor subunit TctC
MEFLMLGAHRIAAFAVLALVTSFACAQSFPTKPIRWIIDFPPGGPSDSLARVVGEKLSAALGQPIVYDNRPGANGVIAYGLAARAPADGYTLAILSTPFPLNAALGRKLTYDTLKDFTPISLIANYPNLLVVHPSVPARSVKEFVAFAKSKAGSVTYASSGTGSVQHLAMELVRRLAGFEALHVPYAGSAPAVANLVGGHVQSSITILVTVIPHMRAGRVRGIAILSESRSNQVPEVPTFIESGISVVAPGWGGMGAPAGVPGRIVKQLNAEVARIVDLPDVRERILTVGGEPRHSTPQEFATLIRSEYDRWRPVVQQAGVKIDD